MSSLQKDTKIYGAVQSESFITFTGFCKRIYDTAQQSVDVFIDEKKVDTILADQKIPDIENKYEVFDTNGFCFTYELPKEYIGQKHKLEFKTKDGEQLLHSPTHTIDKFSPLYNQAMFIESLHQSIKYDVVKEGYSKNVLSFIAIEENLNDEAFVQYVLEMIKKHKELTLGIAYFNEHQKNQATKVFNQVKNKKFFNPSSVEEIIKNSEIYVHNTVEEFRFTINEEYYNKVKNQNTIKESLFIVELTRKAKKKKDMAEMTVDTVSPVVFETSAVSEIFKDDERYNEFVFMNSLGRVDEEKIKDMYCPNSIGFLATKENLEDEEFMGYIKELMRRFPNVQFKGFCFDDTQKSLFERIFLNLTVSFVVLKDIASVFNNIEIYLCNASGTEELTTYYKLQNTIRISSHNVLIAYYDKSKNKLIKELQNNIDFQEHPYVKYFDFFGYDEKDINSANENIYRLLWDTILKRLEINNLNINDMTGNELIFFKHIELGLKYPKYKQYFHNLYSKEELKRNG